MSLAQLKAYKDVEKNTASPRENEARILTEGASKLQLCQEKWESEERDMILDAALKYNQRIWTFFQGELARPDHPLPKETRLNLLRLSSFIDRQIFRTMAAPSPEKLDSIININLGIAKGLRMNIKPQVEKVE